MNFLRKLSYSFPYKGAYGKRKQQHKKIAQRYQQNNAKQCTIKQRIGQRYTLFYYMVIYLDIITFIRGDHYAYN